MLAEAQRLGYAEADPSADIDGYDARSKLAILSALAFGEKITPSDIYTEGIRRISPIDFGYAHHLGHTIRLLCTARQTPRRPDPRGAAVHGAGQHDPGGCRRLLQRRLGARAVRRGHLLLRARRGPEAHRCRRGQRPDAGGPRNPLRQPRARVAVRARAARRVSAHPRHRCRRRRSTCASAYTTVPASSPRSPKILADKHIGMEAVLQLPCDSKHDLPFAITLEARAGARRSARRSRRCPTSTSWSSRHSRCPWTRRYEPAGSRCCSAAVALCAQVAQQANERYQTPEGRASLANSLSAKDRDAKQQPKAIVEMLGIKPGMTVADVGTGTGYMLPYLSEAVGPGGKVIAEDIFPDFLDRARQTASEHKLANVSYVRGTEKDAALGTGIDLELVMDVYHHLDYPAELLASLRARLKPDGRLAIVEYHRQSRGDGTAAPCSISGSTPDDAIKEIESHGFRLVSRGEHKPAAQWVAIFAKK